MNYYIQGCAAKADKIKAAFEKLGIDVLDFGFADKAAVYFSIGGCVQCVPYSINIMNILCTHPDYKELELPVEPKFKNGDTIKLYGENCIIVGVDVTNQLYNIHSDNPIIGYELLFKDQDKAELVEPQPKFKVGDWIVQNDNGTVSQITKTINGKDEYDEYRTYEHTNGYFAACFENEYHLWTIKDAKDGDVLSYQGEVFIARIARGLSANVAIDYDCCYDGNSFILDSFYSLTMDELKEVYPATKQQRDLLFAKMKEAGYKWDADKKELRKIKPHYDIANFQPFDKVLTRDTERGNWNVNLFSYYIDDKDERVTARFRCINSLWKQCIPFNDDTKHLLGTADMCPEEYINW